MRNCSALSTESRNFCALESILSKLISCAVPFASSPNAQRKTRRSESAGIVGAALAEEHGGLGLSLSAFACVSEELGRTLQIGHYLFNCQAPDIGNMEILLPTARPNRKRSTSRRWPAVTCAVVSR